MVVIGPLSMVTSGHRDVNIAVRSYSKLTQVVPTAQIATNTVAEIFITAGVILQDIPSNLLTDSGKTFMSKLFKSLGKYLCTKQLRATENVPQTDGQVERYNSNIVVRH